MATVGPAPDCGARLYVDWPGPATLPIGPADPGATNRAPVLGGGPEQALREAARKLLPDVLPVLYPACGWGTVYLRGIAAGGAPIWEKVLDFQAPPWHSDGRQPARWWLEYSIRLSQPVLFLAAAPEVQVFPLVSPPKFLPFWHVPDIQVVRVPSADLIPPPELPITVHALIGDERHLLRGVDPDDPELSTEEQVVLNVGTADVPVVVKPTMNGVRIRHEYGHWDLGVVIDDPNQPGGFVHQVLPARLVAPGVHSVTVRVVTTPGVTLSLTEADRADQSVLSPFETVSQVRVEYAEVDPALLPQPGDALGGIVRATLVDHRSGLSDRARFVGMVLEFVVGFIPVVGSVMDVAQLTYMAAYGETFWGDDVEPGDLFANGVFALVGVVLDADDFVKLARLGGNLYPGAKLALTSGLDEGFAAAVTHAADPVLLDTMKNLPTADKGKLLGALEEVAETGDAVGVVKAFDEIVTTAYRVALDDDVVPEIVHARAFEVISPVDLPSFTGLDPSAQTAVLDLFVSYRQGVKGALSVVDELAPTLQREYGELFDLWRATGVFDVTFTGFTIPRLQEGFRKYLARGGRKNAVEWAIAQRSGQYVDLLKQRLGGGFKDLLRQVAEQQYWEVPAAAKLVFEKYANRVQAYWWLRARVPTGMGKWLQVDHILERRFMKRPQFGDYELADLTDDFQSLLVARNPAVARQVAAHSYYVHSVKTELLRRLIPHHLENNYSLQNILDAYVVVFVHQLKVPVDVFERLVVDDFRKLRALGYETMTYRRNESVSAILLRNPLFVAAMNLPMP
jgi:hypothetical protein